MEVKREAVDIDPLSTPLVVAGFEVSTEGSQPVQRVIEIVNPQLRGWGNYFAYGNASQCFSYIRDWLEKKVRRHLARNSKRSGFGWKRWSRRWLCTNLGLFGAYRVSYRPTQKALPV